MFDTLGLTAFSRDALLNEVQLLARLDHPHIVQFREAYLGERHKLCVVMDLLTGGTLADLVR